MAEQQLFNAARDGNLEMVEHLLEDEDVPIDTPGVRGDTPFTVAFKNGHYDVARRLALEGADVNYVNHITGRPLLCVLANIGPTEDVPRFLQLPGANPNVMDDDRITPLLYAAKRENLETARALLHAGADVNVQEPDGDNVLAISIRKNNYELFMLFLNAGANPNMTGAYNTPLLLDALSVVDELRFATALFDRGANINVEFDGRPLFHAVVAFAEISAIKLALEHGADINLADEDGDVPLTVAIQENREDVFKFLLREGARITPGVREAAAASHAFASILADYERLEPIIGTEPLPRGTKVENVWARANTGESLNTIIANLEAARAANLAEIMRERNNGSTRRRKARRRGKTQRRRKSRRSTRK